MHIGQISWNIFTFSPYKNSNDQFVYKQILYKVSDWIKIQSSKYDEWWQVSGWVPPPVGSYSVSNSPTPDRVQCSPKTPTGGTWNQIIQTTDSAENKNSFYYFKQPVIYFRISFLPSNKSVTHLLNC